MDGSPTEKGSAWMMVDANQLLRWVLKSKNRNLTTTTPMKTARFFWDLDFEDNSDQGSSEAPDGSYDFRQRCVSSSVRQENWTTNYRTDCTLGARRTYSEAAIALVAAYIDTRRHG
ncbi:hypothetical protein VTP01DRAFT_3202 [Rhizomucor pusillus]|uniref:uncharacterized protein n=1 Tax=Rhizomucor pusillus TaxID=4840 RepID=UPI003742A578